MNDQRGSKTSENTKTAEAGESESGTPSLSSAQSSSSARSVSERPPPGRGSSPPPSRADSTSGMRAVGVSSEEQRKLEDIRKKLKDIFVTNEKQEAAPEVVKPAEQQTVSSGLLDLRDIAKLHEDAEKNAGVDDMLFLSGGLFGDARTSGGSSSIEAPDVSRPSALPLKPPPPPQAAKSASVLDEILVEAEVEPVSAKSDDKLLKALAKAPPAPAPKAASDEMHAAAPKPMSNGLIAVIAIGVIAVLGGVFYLVMKTGEEEPGKTASNTEGTAVSAGERPPSDQGTRLGQGSGDTAAGSDSPSAAVVPGSRDPGSAGTAKSTAEQGATDPGKSGGSKANPEATQGGATKDPGASGAPGKTTATAAATTAAPPATTEAPKAPPPPPPPAAAEFNADAARNAMSGAAAKAASCKGDGPSGSATVSVTFSTSGRVTSARLEGGSLQGTPAGGCIVSAFRGISVPPFDGSPVTVRKTVSVR